MVKLELIEAPRRQRKARSQSKAVAKQQQSGVRGRSNNIVIPVPNTSMRGNPDVRLTQIRAPKMPRAKPQLSQCGLDFLKCAFASPDFDVTGAQGIPDNYAGRTLMSQQTLVRPSTAPPGQDTYVLVSPMFGSAFLSQSVATGANATNLTSTNWPGYSNLGLGAQPATGTVSRFRYASLAAEIQCTMNEMTWAGNISVFKIPFTMDVQDFSNVILVPPAIQNNYIPGGIGDLSTVPFNNIYTSPFNLGCYSTSFNRTGSFDFKDVISDLSSGVIPQFSNGQTTITAPFRGMDDMDTIVFKISIPSGASGQSYILRTWACVELQVVPQSFIYEFTTLSCPHDALALDLYKYVAERLPVAVPYRDNADFWKRVYNFIRSATAALSKMPGPVGDIASGINLLSGGIASLVL
jgi:hypothetical protein